MSRFVRDRLPGEYRWWMKFLPARVSLIIIGLRLIGRVPAEHLPAIREAIDNARKASRR